MSAPWIWWPGRTTPTCRRRISRKRFAEADATTAERVITYCGGGIAASSAALVLSLLGVSDVAVYDGSLQEWAADPTLPMERG